MFKNEEISKFWSNVKKTDSCWLWTGALNGGGYGSLYFDGSVQGTHRISWLIHVGRIPFDKYVLHNTECPNRNCINPNHLHLGTPSENIKETYLTGRKVSLESAVNKAAENKRSQEYCKHGHEFSEENTRIRYGKRECLKCSKEGNHRRYLLKKSLSNA